MVAAVRRVIRWLGRRPWTLAMVMWLVLAVPGFVVVQIDHDRSDRFVDCLTGWANETSGRSTALGKVTQERDDAEADVLRAAANRNIDGLNSALAKYVDKDDQRKAALERNPVPEPPTLRCRR